VYCELIGPKVKLEAFPGDLRVEVDANTVQTGILRLIPGITDEEISKWLAERTRKPFTSGADFRQRGIVSADRLKTLNFERW
jgi:predicted nucleic acid-binding OB-fold protein